MKNLLFCGCSYVAGSGFDLEKEEPGLWVNLIHQNLFKNFNLINSSRGGRSNSGIFQDAVFNITNTPIDVAFVCWTSMPRYEIELGLELYSTRAIFIPNSQQREHNLNNINYTKNYLQSLNDRFTALSHLHYEILNLIYYVNSLIALSKKFGTKIYFVNSLCPWDLDYFQKLENVLPNLYTSYTQEILNLKNRSDSEVYKLYNKIHKEYLAAGGIQENYWLNLYSSLRDNKIDTNQDSIHPGIESNQLFYNILSQSL
jgi:hypothetical protein